MGEDDSASPGRGAGAVLGGDEESRFGVARIEVVSARLNLGGDGMSAFTEVTFSSGSNLQVAQTEVCARSRNPVWRKRNRFDFNVWQRSDVATFSVRHRRLMGHHRPLGVAEVKIGGLAGMSGDRWLPLRAPEGTWSRGPPGEIHVRWIYHYCYAGDLLLGRAELGEQQQEFDWLKLVAEIIRMQGHISRFRGGPLRYLSDTVRWVRPVRTLGWLAVLYIGVCVYPIVLSALFPASCAVLLIRNRTRSWFAKDGPTRRAAPDAEARERLRKDAARALVCACCRSAFVRFVSSRVICGACCGAFCERCCRSTAVSQGGGHPVRVCEECADSARLARDIAAHSRLQAARRSVAASAAQLASPRSESRRRCFGMLQRAARQKGTALHRAAREKGTELVGAVRERVELTQQMMREGVHTVSGLIRGNAGALVLSPAQEQELVRFQHFCTRMSDRLDRYYDVYTWQRSNTAFSITLGSGVVTVLVLWGLMPGWCNLFCGLFAARVIGVPAVRLFPDSWQSARAAVRRQGWRAARVLEGWLWALPQSRYLAGWLPKSTEQQVEEALPPLPRAAALSYRDWKKIVDSRELMRELLLDRARARDVCSIEGTKMIGGAAVRAAGAANPYRIDYSAFTPSALLGELWDLTGDVLAEDLRRALHNAQDRASGSGAAAAGALPAMLGGVVGGTARSTAGALSWVKNSLRAPMDALDAIISQPQRGSPARARDRRGTQVNRPAQGGPRGLIGSSIGGAGNLVSECIGGVTGLFTEPVNGARERGAVGFVAGMAKGMVGAVTRPVTGTLDMLEGVCNGFANDVNAVVQNKGKRRRPHRTPASPASPTSEGPTSPGGGPAAAAKRRAKRMSFAANHSITSAFSTASAALTSTVGEARRAVGRVRGQSAARGGTAAPLTPGAASTPGVAFDLTVTTSPELHPSTAPCDELEGTLPSALVMTQRDPHSASSRPPPRPPPPPGRLASDRNRRRPCLPCRPRAQTAAEAELESTMTRMPTGQGALRGAPLPAPPPRWSTEIWDTQADRSARSTPTADECEGAQPAERPPSPQRRPSTAAARRVPPPPPPRAPMGARRPQPPQHDPLLAAAVSARAPSEPEPSAVSRGLLAGLADRAVPDRSTGKIPGGSPPPTPLQLGRGMGRCPTRAGSRGGVER